MPERECVGRRKGGRGLWGWARKPELLRADFQALRKVCCPGMRPGAPGMRRADLALRGESGKGRPFLVITETHVLLLPDPASPIPPASSLSPRTGFTLAPGSALSCVQA